MQKILAFQFNADLSNFLLPIQTIKHPVRKNKTEIKANPRGNVEWNK